LRIIAGAWRGRKLVAPAGQATRPTADRVRQALFDALLHAPWGGRDVIETKNVLDAFAGTGALGLEALSRGAGHATFMDRDRAALAAIRANIASCRAEGLCSVLAVDATAPPPAPTPCSLVFLDPPYEAELLERALAALAAQNWLAPEALLVIETDRQKSVALPDADLLLDRSHGAARLTVLRRRSAESLPRWRTALWRPP
jgi:16S rRNA (guanine966-N2)-methyltransferase